MSFTSYLVRPFDFSHENIFFREFSKQLEDVYGTIQGRNVLVGNLIIQGHQIDAIFIGNGKIIVIDFKDYEGTLSFSEQNPWKLTTSQGELLYVAGGSRQRNPYQQLQAYRYSLIEFLKNNENEINDAPDNHIKWYHISSLVFFQRPIKFHHNKIPGKISRYFFVTDEKHGIDKIKDIHSKGLNLHDSEINSILKFLDIRDENKLSTYTFDEKKKTSNDQASRVSLINRLLENTSGTEEQRILEYYRTLISVEKYKEPSKIEKTYIRIDQQQKLEDYKLDISVSDSFYSSFLKNKQERFPKDLFIGINLKLESQELTLFQTVIPSSDFNENSFNINLNDFEIYDKALESLNLTEDIIEELKSSMNSIDNFVGKVKILEDVLESKIEIAGNWSIGLCETNFYSAQLLSELKTLRGKDPLKTNNNVFRQFLIKEKIALNTKSILKNYVPISVLNTSQEKAIKQCFVRNLSVITGPPGTGKSQVVQNIIGNAIMNDLSCLFVSKNNRAVDNVVERLSELLHEDYLLRFGSKMEINEKTKPKIKKLITEKNKGTYQDKNKDLEIVLKGIDKINSNINSLQVKINSIPPLTREVLNLKKDAEYKEYELKKWLSSLDPDLKDIFIDKECNIKILSFKSLSNQVKKVNSSALYRFFFRIFFQKKFFQKVEQLNLNQHEEVIVYLEKVAPYIEIEKDQLLSSQENLKLISKLHGDAKSIKNKNTNLYSLLKESKQAYRVKNSQLKILNKEQYTLDIEKQQSKLVDAGKTALNLKINQNLRSQKPYEIQKVLDQLPFNLWRKEELAELKKNYIEFLKDYKVTCLTNLSVKSSVPLESEVFDLLVIDEASQCDVASALPLIYRAKKVVIIGDPLQLSHITNITASEEEVLLEKLNLTHKGISYMKKSLYDYAEEITNASGIESDFLSDHYRCHPEIINFSNDNFYQAKMGQSMDVKTTKEQFGEKSGLFWIDVKGDMDRFRNVNLAEVDCIVDLVKKLRIKYPQDSIGIVTPFNHQYREIFNKLDNETRQYVKVDTVHKFQGDEKDIMIFSLVISPSSTPGKAWFINRNYNLLNVAITRAKARLFIVGNNKFCASLMEGYEKTPLALLADYSKSLNKLIIN